MTPAPREEDATPPRGAIKVVAAFARSLVVVVITPMGREAAAIASLAAHVVALEDVIAPNP